MGDTRWQDLSLIAIGIQTTLACRYPASGTFTDFTVNIR
jgi:hypothetical protein